MKTWKLAVALAWALHIMAVIAMAGCGGGAPSNARLELSIRIARDVAKVYTQDHIARMTDDELTEFADRYHGVLTLAAETGDCLDSIEVFVHDELTARGLDHD